MRTKGAEAATESFVQLVYKHDGNILLGDCFSETAQLYSRVKGDIQHTPIIKLLVKS